MKKIHKIERCMRCSRIFKPIVQGNIGSLINLSELIVEYIESFKNNEASNPLFFTTAVGVYDEKKDKYLCMCPRCSAYIVEEFVAYRADKYQEILFRNFDNAI